MTRIIKQETVKETPLVWLTGHFRRKFLVSTIFLMVNHGDEDTPLWYETMVFFNGDWAERWADRYTTIEQARAGHERAVEIAKSGQLHR